MYLIVIVLIIAILYYFVSVYPKKVLAKKMLRSVALVKLALFVLLKNTYSINISDEKEVGLLSAAVTNGLFAESPISDEGMEYIKTNEGKVEKYLSGLGEIITNHDDRLLITQSTQLYNVLRTMDDSLPDSDTMHKWHTRIKNSGIFVSGVPAPDYNRYQNDAIEYLERIRLKYGE